MYVEKIFSSNENDERYYSVILDEYEAALFSEAKEKLYAGIMIMGGLNRANRGMGAALKAQKNANNTPAGLNISGRNVAPDPYTTFANAPKATVTEVPAKQSLMDRMHGFFSRGKQAASQAWGSTKSAVQSGMDKVGAGLTKAGNAAYNTLYANQQRGYKPGMDLNEKISQGIDKAHGALSAVADDMVNQGRGGYRPVGNGALQAASAAGTYGGKRSAMNIGTSLSGTEGLSGGRMAGAAGSIRRGRFQSRFSEIDDNEEYYED